MDQKDHVIQALQEMVTELTSKLINLRAVFGMELEKKQAELEKQKSNGYREADQSDVTTVRQ